MAHVQTPREQSIQDYLVSALSSDGYWRTQFGGPSYKERKHVLERLDAAFIEGEIAHLGKMKRWMPIAMFGGPMLVWFSGFGWEMISGQVARAEFLAAVNGFMFAAILAVAYILYRAYAKRLLLYRGLELLAKGAPSIESEAHARGPELSVGMS